MATWLGQSGNINDPSKYYGQPVSFTFNGAPTNVIGWYIAQGSVVSPTADLSFGSGPGPTPGAPIKGDQDGEGENPGGVLKPYLRFTVYYEPAPAAPNPHIVSGGAAPVTVSGDATVGTIEVGSGAGGPVTFTGSLTTNGNSLFLGPTNITGSYTDQTVATVSQDLTISGTAKFKGIVDPVLGQESLVLTYGRSTIASGGKVTTAGLFIGPPTTPAPPSSANPALNINGMLTDTDKTNGIAIAAGDDLRGTVYVAGGQVQSVVVTDGKAGGVGKVTLGGNSTWTNTKTFAVGAKATLTVMSTGDLKTGGLTADGMVTVSGGKIEGTDPAGVFQIDKGGMLTVSDNGTVSTPLLQTLTGSTTSFTTAKLTNSGTSGAPGGAAMLDGAVDFIGATVDETANQGAITVGFDHGDGSDSAAVTARNATISASSTVIASGQQGDKTTGTLTIDGGTWMDTGSSTTMTIGSGGAGTLSLTGGATLTDQDVVIATTASDGTSEAKLTGSSTWTIKGKLTAGGAGQGTVSIDTGSTAAVAGGVTIAAPTDGQSTVAVTGGTLTAGANIQLGGTGSGTAELRITGGMVKAANGSVQITSGRVDISGQGAMLQAQGLVIGGSSNVVTNDVTINEGGDVQLSGAAGATLDIGSALDLEGGTLEAAAVTTKQYSTPKGYGTIKGIGGADTNVQLGGATLSVEGGTLKIDGALGGGPVAINDGATLWVTGALTCDTITFYGKSRLVLGTYDPAATAAIANFATGDAIDIARSADKAVVNDDVLTVTSGGQYVESFNLSGDYTGATFDVVNTGGGVGSEITLVSGGHTQKPAPTAPPPAPPTDPMQGFISNLDLGAIDDPSAQSLTVTVDDVNGLLGATASGSAVVTGGGTSLTVSGTVADVNATLATVTYEATVPGTDTVNVGYVDDQGAGGTQSTSFSVPDDGLSLSVPGAQSITAGAPAAVTGISVANTLSDPTAVFTVTLSDTSGVLAVTEAGSAVVTGQGTATLTVSGDLLSVDRTLATLTYTTAAGGAASSDTLNVAVADAYGGTQSQFIALAIAQPVAATETDWATGSDGDAGDAANWTAGVPDAALLTVLPEGYYTVSGAVTAGKIEVLGSLVFTGSVSAAGAAGDYQTFVVDDGGDANNEAAATFDGGTLDTASLVVGNTGMGTVALVDGAQATLTGSGPEGPAESAYIGFGGNGSSSSGVLAVTGSTVTAVEGLSIGQHGLGALDVNGGGQVTTGSGGGAYATDVVGGADDGAGAIDVDGAGSVFHSEAQLFLGEAGTGVLNLSNAGSVIIDGPAGGVAAYVGYGATGLGSISVDGDGTVLDVTQNLVLGFDGTAQVNVTDGGTLEVDGSLLRVARDAGSIADVQVYGPGANIDAPNAELSLALDGTGSMTVAGGAAVTVGSVVIGGNADATAMLEVDAGSILTVNGAFTDGAAANTSITLDGGTIATNGGLNIGNGTQTVLTVQSGGTIEGGIGLGAGAILNADQTAVFLGTLTLSGGQFNFSDTSGTAETDTLAAPIIVSGPVQSTVSGGLSLTGGIAFASEAGARLLVGSGITLDSAVTGFQAGDTLDLQNFVNTAQLPDTATWSDGVLSLSAQQYGGGAVLETIDLPGDFATANFSVTPDAVGTGVDVATCFARGTRIAGPDGEIAVEDLAIGALVITADGQFHPVKWIGRRSYAGAFVAGNHLMLPVCIKMGAIGAGVPHADLRVSPGHGMFVDGQLVPAWRLINGVSIVQARAVESVTYYHVELACHAVILANGAPAESFLDDACRGQFQNAAEFRVLYPGARPLAPMQSRLEDGFALWFIQDRLADRAGIPFTVEPAGILRGYLDQAGPERVCGWAQDADSPEEPVALEVLVDGAPVLCVLANGYRADLRKAGLGSGCHAFDMNLPTSGAVIVRRISDGAALTLTASAQELLAA